MIREKIKLNDGKKIELVSNAKTPILYSLHFQSDFFNDLGKIEEDKTLIISQLAYIMNQQATNEEVEYSEWLTRYNTFDLINLGEVIGEMWAKENFMHSKLKKKAKTSIGTILSGFMHSGLKN